MNVRAGTPRANTEMKAHSGNTFKCSERACLNVRVWMCSFWHVVTLESHLAKHRQAVGAERVAIEGAAKRGLGVGGRRQDGASEPAEVLCEKQHADDLRKFPRWSFPLALHKTRCPVMVHAGISLCCMASFI